MTFLYLSKCLGEDHYIAVFQMHDGQRVEWVVTLAQGEKLVGCLN